MRKWSDDFLLSIIISFIGDNSKGFSLEYYGIVSPPINDTYKNTLSIVLPKNRTVLVNVVELEIFGLCDW